MRRSLAFLLVVLGAPLLVAGPAAAALEGGTAGPSSAVAVVATGRLQTTSDRFFQTFSTDGGRWRLSTPSGVATNGGIVLAGPDAGLAAVLPFFASHVTALVPFDRGVPKGRGGVAPALAIGPSALATGAAGSLAAVLRDGRVALASPSGWRTRTTRAALATGAKGCGLLGLSAVAIGEDGSIAVGGRCRNAGYTGLFVASRTGRFSALRSSGRSPASVLRLQRTSGGFAALLERSGSRRSLEAVSTAPSAAEAGISMALRPGESVCSTASTALPGGSAGFAAALCSRAGARVVLVSDQASSRPIEAGLPRGSRAIAFGPSGTPADLARSEQRTRHAPVQGLWAFCVDGRRVQPWRLDATAARWRPDGPAFVLSLPYGSSR